MSLEKIIKFNYEINEYFNNSDYLKNPTIKFIIPLVIKDFTIKSNEKIFYNIIINGKYLIYYQSIDRDYTEYNDYDNCIISEYNNLDGYYNIFKFNINIYIESIEIENKNPLNKDLPDIYFEYDPDHLVEDKSELDNEYIDSYCFRKKYFKFLNKIEDIQLIKIYSMHVEYHNNKRTSTEKSLDESEYKFKHLKNNTYYVEFDDEQFKRTDYYYKFNNMNCFSSYYPII